MSAGGLLLHKVTLISWRTFLRAVLSLQDEHQVIIRNRVPVAVILDRPNEACIAVAHGAAKIEVRVVCLGMEHRRGIAWVMHRISMMQIRAIAREDLAQSH